jgi:FdhD protein
VAVTMRTPGHDRELAVGFLYAEGLIRSCADIVTVTAGSLPWEAQPCNVVTVRLSCPVDLAPLQRNFLATSSCGVCGKASLEQIAVRCLPVSPGPVLAGSVLVGLPLILRQANGSSSRPAGYMPAVCLM